jgi:phage-related protein
MLAKSKRGCEMASRVEMAGARLSLQTKLPCTWQARMRSCSMTGVWLASDSSKPCSTASTIEPRLGRGSSSHICDFIAKAWVRSWMMLEPSP